MDVSRQNLVNALRELGLNRMAERAAAGQYHWSVSGRAYRPNIWQLRIDFAPFRYRIPRDKFKALLDRIKTGDFDKDKP